MDDAKKVFDRAVMLLGLRAHGQKELRDKLVQKGASSEHAEQAVAKLVDMGFLNDEEYAQAVARAARNKGHGVSRLKNELYKRGISGEIAEQVTLEFEPDEQKLLQIVRSKLGNGPVDEGKIRRTREALYRRGYTWEQTARAIDAYLEETREEYELD